MSLAGKYKTKRKIDIEVESSESDTHSTEKKRQRTGSPIETEQEIHKQDQEPQKTEQQPSTPPLTDSRQSDSSSNENGDGEVDIDPSTIKAKTKPKIGKGKGKKGKQLEEPIVQCSFTEEEEQEIAKWLETKKLLYDIKDKDYKQKALKRQLWETKAAEYGVNYAAIQKWYQTQRTRFSKLREGQPKHKSTKRSGDGFSSGDDEDPIPQGEVSENDSDRDKFIRRIFAFLRPHIKRHKKDTPASVSVLYKYTSNGYGDTFFLCTVIA
ncbi:Hypothetical predicted protein [Mytilus galloprovincialis]|uniref:MADF domain-containing protein n=1 Tax=Mytilus galloprovincialis TaxID=29158 RepID=A0A8B6BW78_MYTGA|nr:Hypothetical predicted protein [Mytilus galloprovincialis]